jgi:hypothetical protein
MSERRTAAQIREEIAAERAGVDSSLASLREDVRTARRQVSLLGSAGFGALTLLRLVRALRRRS